ncbi:MAG: DNA repair protein RecN, partial [Bryobacteraceae bacterium]
LIEREILAGGKSRAFVDSRPVTLAVLKETAPRLGDIHGQHEQQQLFAAAAQLQMLDSFAAIDRGPLGALFEKWTRAGQELAELERSEQERLRLFDLWSFQRKEIEEAAPVAGEDQTLEEERRVLLNLGRLQEGAGAAYTALYDAQDSAQSLVGMAARKLDDLARVDSKLAAIRANLEPAVIAIRDVAYELGDYVGRLEANPGRLEQIESRLHTLEKLKRKYGSTLEEVLAFFDDVRAKVDSVESAGGRAEALRKERERLAEEFRSGAARLSARRGQAARELDKQVVGELASLAMERAQFRIALEEAPWSDSGADAVHFLVSANVGEEPKPLEKIASGGELSRIALALKTCLASSGGGRTLVFDEVDAGVGGRAAEGIGRRLRQLAASDQVLCVTHLAQIAGFATHHFRVEKTETRGRTMTVVEELDRDGRVREIGRMLSGEQLTPEALRHAEQLIAAGSARR